MNCISFSLRTASLIENDNTYMFFLTYYCTAVRGGLDED